MTDRHQTIATTQIPIRRPVSVVFAAFVDAAITSRFWFSRGSGRLEGGKQVRWDWEMYSVGTTIDVKALEPDKCILIEWDGPEDPKALDSTGGFHLVLAGAKFFLEHGIESNLVVDRAPRPSLQAGRPGDEDRSRTGDVAAKDGRILTGDCVIGDWAVVHVGTNVTNRPDSPITKSIHPITNHPMKSPNHPITQSPVTQSPYGATGASAAPLWWILEQLVLIDRGVHLELDAHLADFCGGFHRVARHA